MLKRALFVLVAAGWVAAGFGGAPAAAADSAAQAQAMAGLWQGQYHYPKDERPPVRFKLKLTAGGTTYFSGLMYEPNTFGDHSNNELAADIIGYADEKGVVTFLKKYDGTAGADHVVIYRGQLVGRDRLEGTWTVPDAWSGRFEMWR